MLVGRTLFIGLSLSTLACASTGSPPAVQPTTATTVTAAVDTVVQTDTIVVERQNTELEARVARLEIMLLERNARIVDLTGTLAETRQEVVRNLAKLQSQASRAEAASGLAEAEIALQSIARMSGAQELPSYSEATAALEEGSQAFAAENFGGALYLATQARSLAASARSRLDPGSAGELRPGETVFATRVPLRTIDQRANVRQGPGLEHGVVATLDAATPVVGQSYTDEWVRIEDDEGREGWIFHTLVMARSP
ncbi:MAG: SH3 domain-containing protein [Gemmatimonadetes bacterium]|nr:SH3 domain-containing protein [Gemmatimonadota bacterium]NNF14737.1 SH3 domain-containing protein [Gemmatimonadota bacterium]